MFIWDEKYLLGDIFLDSEHKILFRLAEKISGEGGLLSHEELLRYLHAIMEYTVFHFEHEEKLMREVGWSGYERHKEIHRTIIAEMRETVQKNPNIVKLQVKLSQLLTKWIVDHVSLEDQKFKNDLVQKRGFLTLD